MALSVDWPTKVIFVPKADLTLVQSTPTEIRSLDTNAFRLELKAIEADEGMPFLDTHQHNPPVSVGGVTLARVIEIINGYTVTFEDGQYAVNLVGSNNNIGDRVNVNQVSIRSANSAGLVTAQAIEYGEYGGGVTVKPSASGTGTVYPKGTERDPVNNLTDALIIAAARGFTKLFIKEDITIGGGLNYDGLTILGESESTTDITISGAASLIDTTFLNCTIGGILDGGATIRDCVINDLVYFNGIIDNCILQGNIQLGGNATAIIKDSASGLSGSSTPIIDMGGDGPSLALRNYSGGILLQNKTGNTNVSSSVDLNSGQVIFANTITEGNFIVRGIGKITNNSAGNARIAAEILDTVNLNKTLFYEAAVHIDLTDGSNGVEYPIGTFVQLSNNITDARTIAENNNLKSYQFSGVLVIPTDHIGWTFLGTGPITSTTVFTGTNISGSHLNNLSAVGDFGNPAIALDIRDSGVQDASNISGIFADCVIGGNINISNTTATSRFIRCTSSSTDPIINLANTNAVRFINWEGGLSFINGHANSDVIIDSNSGNIIINDSCVGGTFILRGVGQWENKEYYSGNATVIDLLINNRNVWYTDISDYAVGTAGNSLSSASGANISVSGLTTEQATMLMEIYALYGLDPTKPLVVTDTARIAGANISQTISSNVTTTTVTRI